MPERIFGHILGYPEGSGFGSRTELSEAGLHKPLIAGISGSGREGADSIVLSGGYEDDLDLGGVIIYTGHGGRDPDTGKQIANQTLTRGNLALAYNKLNGLPVRVIRGANHVSPYSPPAGYRYDGLYTVDDYWHEKGKSGYDVWRYRLVKLEGTAVPTHLIAEEEASYSAAPRDETTILRIVRDTVQGRYIKALYHYRCQMCGVRLEGTAGPYAETAHIRPLGQPHNGPDTLDNILCLCPNHHVLFDTGGVAIADDFSLIGEEGQLMVDPRHSINKEHLRYHREHYLTEP